MAFSRFEDGFALIGNNRLAIKLELDCLQLKFVWIYWGVHLSDLFWEVFGNATNRIRGCLTKAANRGIDHHDG